MKAPRSPAVPKTESLPVLANVRPLGAGGLGDFRNKEMNDSFQTEKRGGAGGNPLKGMQDAANKALQHDMDLRFENQDRMINYLIH